MPIDPSIALQVKPYQGPDIAKLMSLQDMSQKMQMQNMQMEEYGRKRQTENALRELFNKNPNATADDVGRIDLDRGLKMREVEAKRNLDNSTIARNTSQGRNFESSIEERKKKASDDVVKTLISNAQSLYAKNKDRPDAEEKTISDLREYWGGLENTGVWGASQKEIGRTLTGTLTPQLLQQILSAQPVDTKNIQILSDGLGGGNVIDKTQFVRPFSNPQQTVPLSSVGQQPAPATAQKAPPIAPGAATTWNGAPLRTEAQVRASIGNIPQEPMVPPGADAAQVLFDSQRQQPPQRGVLATIPGRPKEAKLVPTMGPDGKAVWGDQVKGGEIVNPSTNPPAGNFAVTGEEYLNSIPTADRSFIKKLANYEIDPKSLETRGGERSRAFKMAAQYNPDFDQKNYNTISQAINRFATGPQGNTVRSLNVAIEHMDTARKLGDALKNTDFPLFNKLANELATQTGKPAPTNFNAVKEIVADEVVKGVIGGAGALADREAAAKKIRDASSPAQLKGVLDSWTELLGGQLKGLERQYEGATTRKDFRQKYVTPRALEAIGEHEPKNRRASDKSGEWTPDKESRYQELLRKQNAP